MDLSFHETVIKLNSGAERSGDFVSVNQIFVTDNGAYRLTMTGLKDDNKNAVLETFMAYFDPQSKKAIETGLSNENGFVIMLPYYSSAVIQHR